VCQIIWIVAIVFSQAFILDPTLLGVPYAPLVYVILFVLFPYQYESWSVLLFGFIVGIAVDLLLQSGGVHTVASLITCFSRPLLVRIAYRDTISLKELRIENESFISLYFYSTLVIMLHHLFLFMVVAGTFTKIWWLFTTWIANSLLSIAAVFLILILTKNTKP
jgi:hypothetical protein